MRFSVIEGRPGYDKDHRKKIGSIFLDGQLLTGCLEADDQEGWVKELIPDEQKPGYFKHNGTEFLTRERRGQVVINLKDTSRLWDANRTGKARVQVGRDPKTKDILIQVYSLVRPGAIKQMRLEFLKLPSGIDLKAQKAGLAAGAAAEMLCDQFGDNIDPADAAGVAIEQCTAMLLDEGSGKASFILDQHAG